jgi:2-hydroxycyclohexanecarboxyl-CoA dehydrogenase
MEVDVSALHHLKLFTLKSSRSAAQLASVPTSHVDNCLTENYGIAFAHLLSIESLCVRGLSGKVVIVTGGGGIGTAACQRFAEEGAKVAVFDIDRDSAGRTAEQISEAGAGRSFRLRHHRARGLSERRASRRGRNRPDRHPREQCWLGRISPLRRDLPSDWQKIISINLTGARMHHVVLPGMVERHRGRIVNVSSDTARVGSSGEAVYAACKAGLIGYSKTIAREHARHNINVNVVCPGIVNTKLYAEYKKGARNPDKLDDAFAAPFRSAARRTGRSTGAICFLASNDAAYITGQVMSVSAASQWPAK